MPDQPPDHAPAERVSPVQSRAHVPEVHLPRNFEGLLPFGECNIANRQNQLCGDETGPCSASGTLLPSKHKNSYERCKSSIGCVCTCRVRPIALDGFQAMAVPQGRRLLFVLESKDRKSTRLNSSHYCASRMPSSARTKQNEHYLFYYK